MILDTFKNICTTLITVSKLLIAYAAMLVLLVCVLFTFSSGLFFFSFEKGIKTLCEKNAEEEIEALLIGDNIYILVSCEEYNKKVENKTNLKKYRM